MKEKDFSTDRNRMVEDQIISRGIKNKKLIEAMREVPRHEFVPDNWKDYSYSDGPLPIGQGQTISQPYIVAIMTELLEVNEGDRILEIGTGSGYQAAILSKMGCEVYTVEIVEELTEKAKKVIEKLGYENIHFMVGDGYEGWKENSPYDGIIVTASPPEIPQPLLDQLKTRGKLVLPVGHDHQELELITKTESGSDIKDIIPVAFVPMTGKAQKTTHQT